MSITKVTNDNIASLEASKLTGSLPAVDGSSLTNMSSFTKSSSDPAIDTNPSGGVGTLWLNTTSGEMFCCTDATTDENVWTNVGAGTGDVSPFSFQGSTSGYTFGGYTPPYRTHIQKYAFASSSDAATVADMSVASYNGCGHKSHTHAFYSGGYQNAVYSKIATYSFAAEVDATQIGELTEFYTNEAPTGLTSDTHAYVLQQKNGVRNYIERYSTTGSLNNSNDIGDLIHARYGGGACNDISAGYGYYAGGHDGSYVNNIERFAFSSSITTVDIGDLNVTRGNTGGASSLTHGYVSGGWPLGTTATRFSFASTANAVDWGTGLSITRATQGTASGTAYGYVAGGNRPEPNTGSTAKFHIDRFSYESSNQGVQIGDLDVRVYGPVASQV
jgi:hypothetical protein